MSSFLQQCKVHMENIKVYSTIWLLYAQVCNCPVTNGAMDGGWTIDVVGVRGVDRPVDGDGGGRVVGLDGLARCHGVSQCQGLGACAGLVPVSLTRVLGLLGAIHTTPLLLLLTPSFSRFPSTLRLLDRWRPAAYMAGSDSPPPPPVPLLDCGLDPQPGAPYTVNPA